MRPLSLGRYPTPVERVDALSTSHAELWVKHDDRTHDVYGGNKVRKLEWLLADARARGDTRLLTIGAAGSHHVLATTYFGRREGFEVEAVLVPQPRTDHVVEVLRAALGLGLQAFPIASWSLAAPMVAYRRATARNGTRFIPVGGSNVVGAMGYVAAARELAAQVRAGAMPEPDYCVVALGSGGTTAGLAAGFAAEGMKTRVVGACVSKPPWALRLAAVRLARACARRIPSSPSPFPAPHPAAHGTNLGPTDSRFLGRGYGYATQEGDDATRDASAAAGLTLDPTYTAKAFASALWHVRARRGRVILYWHTLSSAPMAPLLKGAPEEADFAPKVRRLLLSQA